MRRGAKTRRRWRQVTVAAAAAAVLLGTQLPGAAAGAPATLTLQVVPPRNQITAVDGEVFYEGSFLVRVPSTAPAYVFLGGSAKGGDFWVDDSMVVTVTKPNGEQTVLSFDNGCGGRKSTPEMDLSAALAPGANNVSIVLKDTCGAMEGNSEIWFTGNSPVSAVPIVTAGRRTMFPKPKVWDPKLPQDCSAIVSGAGRWQFYGPAIFGPWNDGTGAWTEQQLYNLNHTVATSMVIYSWNAVCGLSTAQLSLERKVCGVFGCSWKELAHGPVLNIPAYGWRSFPVVKAKLAAGKNSYRAVLRFTHPEIDFYDEDGWKFPYIVIVDEEKESPPVVLGD